MVQRKILLLSCFALLPLIGCGGTTKSFGPSIEVPAIPSSSSPAGDKLQNVSVAIDEIKDGRPSPALVEYSNGSSTPKTQITESIRSGIEQALQARGMNVSDSAPLILSVEVREWLADMSGVTTKANAAVAIQLFDPANKLMYSGVYRGHAEIRKSALKELELRDTLGIAMAEAIGQIVRDEKLIKLIAAF